MSDDEFERDELDRALAAGLADLAPGEPDAAGELVALRPRMQRARTRHRVLQGSAAAAVVLVLGIGVALASPGDKRSQVQVSNPPTTQNNNLSRGASTTIPGNTTTVPGTTQTTIAGTTIATPGATTPTGGPAPTNPQDDHGGAANPGNGTPTTGPAPSAPTTTVPPVPKTYTYSSNGGSLTVRFANGRLTFVSFDASPGYTGRLHKNVPDDIEARFDNGDRETKVRIRVQGGKVTHEESN